MLVWKMMIFWALWNVKTSSHGSVGLNFGSPTHSSIHCGREEENTQRELYRQKRQAVTLGTSPIEYTIAIEISFVDSSLQKALRSYLNKLSFPLSVDVSDSAVNISRINVTTVCNASGPNSVQCYCESGYGWPAKACKALPVCPGATTAFEESCNCIAQRPLQGATCKLQSEGIPFIYVIKMSVRLDKPFQNALWDSSSTLFKEYKRDLEKAFTEGFTPLRGFRNVTVTEFRPGSTLVQFEVRTAKSMPLETATQKAAEALDPSYNLVPTSFTKEIPGGVNFSISPEHIFEGDTVKMTCESTSNTSNVTWYLSRHLVSNSNRHSITTEVTGGKSTSTLKITSIKLNEAGDYSCSFLKWGNELSSIYKAVDDITVSRIKIVPSDNVSIVCNGTSKKLSCCTENDIQLFTSYWKPNGAINISGSTSSSHNCTTYLLQADESQCPADKSGTKTDYMCELNTTYGARNNKVISVTYFREAKVTISSSPSGSVSEGYHFSLRCTSDVSNYDEVTWQIETESSVNSKVQKGRSIKDVDNKWYATTKTQSGAESVLSVGSANQNWAGTYTCTFSQSVSKSSARMQIEVHPLPLKQEIIRDPIEAFLPCPGTRVLKCCTSKMERYTVAFYVSKWPSLAQKTENRKHGNLSCYYYTLTVTGNHCTSPGRVFDVTCQFTNQINGNVVSSPMSVILIPARKVVCNTSEIGVGENGAVITKPCLTLGNSSSPVRGTITYKCNGTKWDRTEDSCLVEPVNGLLSSAESLVSSPELEQQLPTYLEFLNKTVKKEQKNINTSTANLKAIVEILNLISVIPIDAKQEPMENFLSSVDTIISSPTETWKGFTNGSSELLASVEQFAKSLRPVNDTIPPITNYHLQLKGVVIGKGSVSGYRENFTFTNHSNENLSSSAQIEAKIRPGKSVTIISVAYSRFGHIIPQYNKTDEVVNSMVISTVMSPSSKLGEDFEISMTFAVSNKTLENPRCVFWNFSADGGKWDDTGCESKENGDNVTCSCNHLTSFSVLMSPSHESPWTGLTHITYIGLSISLLSLLICIGVELVVWKSVTKTRISYMRHVCILNIAICLLLADIWFIAVAAMHDKNDQVSQTICTAATFFIHFFYLCVFFWMLTLGLMLFYHLVFILHNASKTTMKAVGFCLGYVCPLVISAITIATTHPQGSYTQKEICLLNWEDSKAVLALVIPAMIVVAMNAVVTIVVIAKISRPSIGEKSISDERSSLYRITKSIGILTSILGLTWGFGLATVFPKSPTIFHILFTIFNAFQGLFILLCGTLWDRKVREAILNKYSLSRWSSQHTKSTSQGISAPMLSISSPFSRTLNNLFGKAGKYQVSSTESPSLSSENTSKAYSLLT